MNGGAIQGDTVSGNWTVWNTAFGSGNLNLQSNNSGTPGYVQVIDGSAFILGDVNALAAALPGNGPQSQIYIAADGNGSFANAADFVGYSVDVYGSSGLTDGFGVAFWRYRWGQ
jgi:hypothetical protein